MTICKQLIDHGAGHDEHIDIMDYGNGKFFVHYGVHEKDDQRWSASQAGPFTSPEEAYAAAKRHRPQAVDK